MLTPQTGRQPLPLNSQEVRAQLRKQHPQDNVDYFATDPNQEIRMLGRLALRREDVNDQFALGDLCAKRSVTDDNRMLIYYVGKTLIAYRRAMQYATNDVDRTLAYRAVDDFVAWIIDKATQQPTRRNLAVALWTVAETEGSALLATLDHPASWLNETTVDNLLDAYREALPETITPNRTRTRPTSETLAMASMPNLGEQEASAATVADHSFNEGALSLEITGEHQQNDQDSLTLRDQHPTQKPLISPALQLHDDKEAFEFQVGDRIEGRYEVADLRRGGMGIVYLCYDHEQRIPVAMKSFQGRFLENDRAIARFVQEAVTWIHLEKHRHIVQARLVQNISGRPHIILEHISGPEGLGPDLKSWIDHKRLDMRQALEFGLHIALGMQHATRKVPGLVHRDLKPANILVTHDSIAKVTDFGLVRSIELDNAPIAELEAEITDLFATEHTRLTRVGAIIGTAPYMSPEQCQSRDVDVRSDIYAFGCLLYEMLTNKTIFQARKIDAWMHAHLNEQPTFPEAFHDTIPQALRDLVLFCVEKRPENRPPSWGAIVDILATIYTDVNGHPPVLDITGQALEARELMDKGYSLTELGRLEEAISAYDQAIALQPTYAWAWARKGRTLRLLNRLEEALYSFDRAIELDPQYAWAWRGKGMIYERLERWEEALICHETAAQINPADAWHWCNQAEVLIHLSRITEAIPLLERATSIDPSHANSWAKLGQVHRLMRNYSLALSAYERAIELDQHYAWAHNGYGLALKALGKSKEALLSFKRAARLAPNDVWHWYNITEMLIDLRQYQEALHPAQQATRTDPNHAFSWAKLGQVYRYIKQLDNAITAYERAIKLDPHYAWAINGLGIVLEQQGRYEEALDAYQRATQTGDGDVWHWYNQGNVLVLMGRYDEALEILQHALKINATHTRSWARLGSVLAQLERHDEALDALAEATRLDPGFAWAWNEQGLIYESLDQLDDALDAFDRAAKAAPHDVHYLYQQADIYSKLGRNADALACLEQALQQDSTNAFTWSKHGQILRRLNRTQDSLRSFTRSVELNPTYSWAWNGRGLTLSALGQRKEAVDCFKKAVELDPTDVWYWYNLADELVSIGQFHDALDALERSTSLNPNHDQSWAKMGHALRRLGRNAEAVTAYDRALAIVPHYAWAWNGRGQALAALERYDEAKVSY